MGDQFWSGSYGSVRILERLSRGCDVKLVEVVGKK
jgi:hypothetical protein